MGPFIENSNHAAYNAHDHNHHDHLDHGESPVTSGDVAEVGVHGLGESKRVAAGSIIGAIAHQRDRHIGSP